MKKCCFRLLFLLLALIMILSLGSSALAAEQTYTDVPASHWAWDSIRQASAKNWFGGYPDGSFRPGGTITRAEGLKVLTVFSSLNAPAVSQTGFPDVAASAWYAPYVAAASHLLPLHGAPEDNALFRPTKPLTREDTVYALVSAAGLLQQTATADESALSSFKDHNDLSPELRACFAVALQNGLVSGYTDNTLRPKNTLTRAEFAALLLRGYLAMGSAKEEKDPAGETTSVTEATVLYKTGLENQVTAGVGNVYYSVAAVVSGRITTVKVAQALYSTLPKGFTAASGGTKNAHGAYDALTPGNTVAVTDIDKTKSYTAVFLWDAVSNRLQQTTLDKVETASGLEFAGMLLLTNAALTTESAPKEEQTPVQTPQPLDAVLYKTGLENQVTAGVGNVYYSVAAVVSGRITTVKVAQALYSTLPNGFRAVSGGTADAFGNYTALTDAQATVITAFSQSAVAGKTLFVWDLTASRLQQADAAQVQTMAGGTVGITTGSMAFLTVQHYPQAAPTTPTTPTTPTEPQQPAVTADGIVLYKTGLENSVTAGKDNQYLSVAAVVSGKITTVKIVPALYNTLPNGFTAASGGTKNAYGSYTALTAAAATPITALDSSALAGKTLFVWDLTASRLKQADAAQVQTMAGGTVGLMTGSMAFLTVQH